MGKTRRLHKTAIGYTTIMLSPEVRPTGMLPRSSEMGSNERITIFK